MVPHTGKYEQLNSMIQCFSGFGKTVQQLNSLDEATHSLIPKMEAIIIVSMKNRVYLLKTRMMFYLFFSCGGEPQELIVQKCFVST